MVACLQTRPQKPLWLDKLGENKQMKKIAQPPSLRSFERLLIGAFPTHKKIYPNSPAPWWFLERLPSRDQILLPVL
jgi:hypothetical protein